MITAIEKAIREKKLAHAYIIEGRDRAARTAFTEEFLEMTGASPLDVHSMERTGMREYRVEDASRFMEALAMRPYGGIIVGMIDDADLLSETVQNKLLKTLEEPSPETVLLLFCANRDSLIRTVRSRCVMARLEDAGSYTDESAAPTDVDEGVEMFLRSANFCDFRAFADKKIDSSETALSLLDGLENAFGSAMMEECSSGGNGMRWSRDICTIERAVSDISRGMNPKKAVKRLFVELKHLK